MNFIDRLIKPSGIDDNKFLRRCVVGFGISAVVTLVSGAMTIANIRQFYISADTVIHTQEVLKELSEVKANLHDMGLQRYKFRLVRNPRHLQLYNQRVMDVVDSMGRIKILIVDNPKQQQAWNELNSLVAKRLQVAAVEMADLDGDIWMRNIAPNSSVEGVNINIRTKIAQMDAEERKLLELRQNRTDFYSRVTVVVLAFCFSIGIAVDILLYYLILNEINRRNKVEEALRNKYPDRAETIQKLDKLIIELRDESRQ